jgi:hypothetical protein
MSGACSNRVEVTPVGLQRHISNSPSSATGVLAMTLGFFWLLNIVDRNASRPSLDNLGTMAAGRALSVSSVFTCGGAARIMKASDATIRERG